MNSATDSRKIVIVGGVAGGASFAARLRRLDEHASIVMFEKGEHISFANCGLPYHIGGAIADREKLIIQTPESFKARYNVEVRVGSEVTSIDSRARTVTVKANGGEYVEPFDCCLLSPGSKPVRPPIPGIDHPRVFTLRNVADMDRIKEHAHHRSAHRCVVIGGGFIGLEMAENLRHLGLGLTLVEMADQVFPPLDKDMVGILHQHLALNGVTLKLETAARGFETGADGSVVVALDGGESVEADFVVLAIGVTPDTGFCEGSGIERTDKGALVVDTHMRTSCPEIYAVGDAVEVTDFVSGAKVHVPLAGPANRQGRIAADNVAGISSHYRHTQGTAICKLFDLSAATTGLNEKNARRHGIDFLKSYTHSASHAAYYPGAFPLSIKLLAAPADGRVLGAQVIGKDGVDKRIDVLAGAVRHKLTVEDLTELETAYAPPFGSAKDPVNMAGYVAGNILSGLMPTFYAEDIAGRDPARSILLDVRTEPEHQRGAIPDSTLIPIDDLRGKLDRLDREKEILVYCQVGIRGYLATRMLLQHEFRAKNLAGGYKTWSLQQPGTRDGAYLQSLSAPSCTSPAQEESSEPVAVVDAAGMQCPGPIMKLKEGLDRLGEGETLTIRATDQGFALDLPAWCSRTGNTLVAMSHSGGTHEATVRKGSSPDRCRLPAGDRSAKTMIVFSNDFDRAMAAFIIANGAASMDSEVTLFFTFWGLNLLRKDSRVSVKKSFMERMFGMMMPRGARRAALSKMNMGGMGTAMMQREMKKKNVDSLDVLMRRARENNVRLVACTMTMDIMGIKREELIEGVEFGGVATYLDKADSAGVNLFV